MSESHPGPNDDPATNDDARKQSMLSRRRVLGGMAAGVGAAAASAFAAGCGKDGSSASGDGPPGYGTGINEDFDGKIELDIRDSTPDWKPFELRKAPEGAPNILVV